MLQFADLVSSWCSRLKGFCKEKGYQSPRGGLACGVRGKIHGWTRGGRHKKHDERQRRTIQENKHKAERF